jgi:xanthine/uracil/vitamin C permease (AzgA family)
MTAMNESARRLGKFAGLTGLVMMILGKNTYHPTNGALSMVFWMGVVFVVIGIFSLRSSRSMGG